MITGRKKRFSTGVAISAAVLSAKPSEM